MRTAAGRLLQSAGAPFSPLSLSPALWLDASVASSITSSAGLVSQWNDLSGNARHAVASGTARPSTGLTTEKSLNVLSWLGGANAATSPRPTTSTTGSIYLLIRTTDAQYVTFLDIDGATHFCLTGQNGNVSAPDGGSGTPTYRRNAAALTTPTRQTIYTALNSVASVVTIESVNFSTWGANFLIGGYFSASFDLVATIGEVVVFGSNLATADRTSMENYLLGKWT